MFLHGRMDAILRMTKNHLYYGGRSIEEGSIKLERMECDGALMFEPAKDDSGPIIMRVMSDSSLVSLRAKARVLAPLLHKTEEAAMSAIRRAMVGKLATHPQT